MKKFRKIKEKNKMKSLIEKYKLPHKCACCEQYEINIEHDICPVCGWEDDCVQNYDHDFAGGANELNLNEYRKQWLESIKAGKHG